jgi:hypothetical protein
MTSFRDRIKGTPIYPLARYGYHYIHSFEVSIKSFIISKSVWDQSGYYKVEPFDEQLSPYYIYVPSLKSSYFQQNIQGQYEKSIISALANHIEPNTEFWNIGAGRGYHSLAFADKACRVVNFEARDKLVNQLERGIAKNNFDNCDVISGYVGKDVYLDEFSSPDVVLMDVEGWEYDILKSSPETIDAHPVWIIELHDKGKTDPNVDTPEMVEPEKVKNLLSKNGYSISPIGNTGKHIIAQ